MLLQNLPDFRWDKTSLMTYKEEPGTHYKGTTRQVLFDGAFPDLPVQLRYFEIQADGYSTLEKHQHAHLVVIMQGKGQVLDGDQIHSVETNDVITFGPDTFHQLRATEGEPLGFLCLVNVDRDRPVLPSEEEWNKLCENPQVAEFIRR
ncbi:MAG TPA: cupin domain-containing protein [Anaerovoracaceae bacterium]|nr:cupin domain-containing protein [Anaerovoracaceae bacterium]